MKSKNNKNQEVVRIGIFQMTGCEGCEIAVSNQEEQIKNLAKITAFPMKTGENNVGKMDVALIEGQVASYEDLELLEEVRENAKYLVAIGTCATEGNYPEAVDEYGVERSLGLEELKKNSEFTQLDESGCLEDFVEVDYYLRGCPVREEELLQFLEKFKKGNFHKNEDLGMPFLGEEQEKDLGSDSITYNPNKCILCRRCVRVCNETMDVHAIGMSDRGPEANVSTPFGESLDDSGCIYCGQCVENCPVGAFDVNSSVRDALETLEDEEETVVVVDPISLVSIGNILPSFGKKLNVVLNKLVSAFRDIGADYVLDYSPFLELSAVAQADLLNDDKKVISSWCPSSRLFIESVFSESENSLFEETFPENLLLSYIQSEYEVDDSNIILVSPCIAQKENDFIDTVISTRELPQLLGAKNIWLDAYPKQEGNFDNDLVPRSRKMLQSKDNIAYTPQILRIANKFDSPDSESSVDSEVIEENVIRYKLEGEKISFTGLVINELSKARKYMGEKSGFDLIELIPCPAGCATGGGQFSTSSISDVEDRFEKLEKLNERIKPSKSSLVELIEDYNEFPEVLL